MKKVKNRAGKSPKVLPVTSPNTLAQTLIQMQKASEAKTIVEFMAKKIEETETLAEYVYRKRIEANVTQKAIGKALGFTSQQYLSNLERGLSLIAPKYLLPLCKMIHCDYDELMILYFAEIVRREIARI